MSESRRQPSVAAELYGLGTAASAWSRDTRTTVDVLDALVDAAIQLDRGEAEYLLIADSPAPRFGPHIDSARPDALLVAAALALHTDAMGLIPSVGLATTEPYHVSRAVATLDIVSAGRGGWNPVLDGDAQRVDRARAEHEPAAPADRLERAGEHIDVTRALATTWARCRRQPAGRGILRVRGHGRSRPSRRPRGRGGPHVVPRFVVSVVLEP